MTAATTARFDQLLAEAADAIGMDPGELREQLWDPRQMYSAAQTLAGMTDAEIRAWPNCNDELVGLLRKYQALNTF